MCDLQTDSNNDGDMEVYPVSIVKKWNPVLMCQSVKSEKTGGISKQPKRLANQPKAIRNCHWSTPVVMKERLQAEFIFDDFDPCPLKSTENSGLQIEWAPKTFVNPPYNDLASTRNRIGWVEKAHMECQRGKLVVLLLPVRTSTSYWHDFIIKFHYEVRYIRGGVAFGDDDTAIAPFAVCIVIMRPESREKEIVKVESKNVFGYTVGEKRQRP
jgi:DNA N-6-adenine-methyltransferase (Dam)